MSLIIYDEGFFECVGACMSLCLFARKPEIYRSGWQSGKAVVSKKGLFLNLRGAASYD